jgi:SsrA-binding protein
MTNQNGIKVIATNPLAFKNYFIEETLEAGIMLTGTEVKSLRSKSANLKDGYVEINQDKNGFTATLNAMHIPTYDHGNIWNHAPTRKRKLLAHKKQLFQLYASLTRHGNTIIPIKIYFSKGWVKVLLGIGKGKKKYDKREDLKKADALRQIQKATKYSR